MAKTTHAKQRRSEKKVYTYKEYMEKVRPKSLGRVEDTDNVPSDCYEKLILEKDCVHPRDLFADRK